MNQPNYDIPRPPREDTPASVAKEDDDDSRSFNLVTEAVTCVSPAAAAAAVAAAAEAPTYQTSETAAMSSLSACNPIPPEAGLKTILENVIKTPEADPSSGHLLRRGGWRLQHPGLGLRGGAPLPGKIILYPVQ